MPFRLRLALVYVALLALALVASGSVGYFIAADRIYNATDDSLRIRSEALAGILANVDAPLTVDDITPKAAELVEQSSADLVFQIRGTDGSVVYSSVQPATGSLPPSQTVDLTVHFETQTVKGNDLRILYQPIVQSEQTLGVIEVAQSLGSSDAALAEIRDVLIVTGLAVALLTTASAYILAGRALRPVQQVSQLAREIELTARFNRRLAVPKTRDEVSELIATFNAMIQRVEQTLLAQKSFLADSSHELRRPLAVLRTNLDVLADDGLPESERRLCIEEMRAEAALMTRLISDLLLLAREESQAIEHQPVDFSRLCHESVAWVEGLGSGHDVSGAIAPGIKVLGDRDRLSQLVLNILENAVQYTPEGGRIEVRLDAVEGMTLLDVTDSGPGIREDELEHVFERFYRSADARQRRPEGTGLGLAIVRYIAEAHGGSVTVQSRAGEGSTVAVQLPLYES